MAEGGSLAGADGAAGLAALISRAAHAGDRLPPVERWDPPHCGSIPMTIRSDGTWFYQGTPIGRPQLVRLFSTVLRREPDGEYVLVTPVEKVGIEVEDAPFVAVEMDAGGMDAGRMDGSEGDGGDGAALTFRTNVGDLTEAGPDHPMRFEGTDGMGELKPYVHVRAGLWALVARPVMYELVELGETVEVDGRAMFAVRSRGETFPIMPASELERLSR